MKKTKTIILTFDYELYLGKRSGTVENCLIKPVELINELFKTLGIRGAIFFIDTTFLATIRTHANSPQLLEAFRKIERQVNYLLENGHYIFPHIHPHWLDAKLMENFEWNLDNMTKYRFESCSNIEKDYLWNQSMEVLKLMRVDTFHPIDGFRAGGWCIQPFDIFKPYFRKFGIKYDFSVMPRNVCYSNAQCYDFRTAPTMSHYKFNDDPTSPDVDGDFFEFPISVRCNSNRNNFLFKLFSKFNSKLGVRSFGDGSGVVPILQPNSPNYSEYEMISMELLNAYTYKAYLDYCRKNDCIQFISHPKMLSLHNLKYFKKIIDVLNNEFYIEYDFKSVSGK